MGPVPAKVGPPIFTPVNVMNYELTEGVLLVNIVKYA